MTLSTLTRRRPAKTRSMEDDSLHRALMPSPLGTVEIISDGTAVMAIHLHRSAANSAALTEIKHDAVTRRAADQLTEYFEGKRESFSLPLAPKGTIFQQTVWNALRDIPFGQCVTYADIARAIGKPIATRAVGAAIGRNPIWIVIPCHRVIGSDGSLTGYAGGLDVKRKLLSLEGASERHRP